MRVTILTDNNAPRGYWSEHGLSLLVETDGGSVLFDSGVSAMWLENMRLLGRDPEKLVAAAFSHGHYDHTGGLQYTIPWIDRMRLYMNEAALVQRYVRHRDMIKSVGILPRTMKFADKFTLVDSPVDITEGVWLSGEVPVVNEAAIPMKGKFCLDEECREIDTFKDERFLLLRSGGKTGLLLGCSHRGVENNVRAAMDAAGTDRLEWIAGGIHLVRADEEHLDCVASFLAGANIGRIICCHCTGDDGFAYLKSRLGEKVEQGMVGMEWAL